MHDFFRRTGSSVLKKSTIEHLVKAGAFDELIDKTLDNDFGRRTELSILEKEKEELGVYVSKNPVDGIWDLLSQNISNEIVDVPDLYQGNRVCVAGVVSSAKKVVTKKGAKMFKFNLQDISSDIEIIVFPREAKNYPDDFFADGDVIKLIGSVSKDGDEENSTTKIVMNSCEKMDLSNFAGGKPIYLKITKDTPLSAFDQVYDIINSKNGGSYVFLDAQEGNKNIRFKYKKTTSITLKEILEDKIKGDQ